jgi:hypothetical protein
MWMLRGVFNPDLFAAPPFVYVALSVGVGLVNQSASTLDEPLAGAYERAAVPLDSANWTLSDYAEVFNAVDIDFPAPAPDEDWGYLGGWALVDAPDGGTTLAVGALVLPTYYTGDQPPLSLGPGAVMVGLID